MTFRIGQRVVCVEGSSWHLAPLIKGDVYTITNIGMFLGGLHVDVAEACSRYSPKLQWRADRFRPLADKQTDISVFTAMLNTKKVRERA